MILPLEWSIEGDTLVVHNPNSLSVLCAFAGQKLRIPAKEKKAFALPRTFCDGDFSDSASRTFT